MIYVDEKRCTGCGACVEVCPTGAIKLVSGVARIDEQECRECEACLEACPEHAILSVEEPVEALVPTEQSAPVLARPNVPAAARPRAVRWAARALPWVGTAALFVGREVLPRAASALLDAWDRRQTMTGSAQPRGTSDTASGTAFPRGASGGRRHRRRGRRGGP